MRRVPVVLAPPGVRGGGAGTEGGGGRRIHLETSLFLDASQMVEAIDPKTVPGRKGRQKDYFRVPRRADFSIFSRIRKSVL